MLEQPDSPTASQTKKSLFDHYLYRLQTEIHSILDAESGYEERTRSLETDLAVFKRACFTSEAEKRALNDEILDLRNKLDALESQNKTTKIVCLIDGDGTIFAPDLMLQGRDGGRLAAKQLSESIHYHLPSTVQPCHLWTYVFFNKRGLLDTFVRAGGQFRGVREVFDDFALGFNQSCERFMMVDVGGQKEASDAKIRVLLDDHVRSQDVFKVVFGGCHDSGYMPQLQSLLTSVYRDKLVLLPGYTEMASEIGNLQIPSLVIPGLFVPDKIVIQPPHKRSLSLSSQKITPINGVPASSNSELGPPPGLPHPDSDEGDLDPPRASSESPPPPPYPSQPETIKESEKPSIIRTRRGSLSSTSTKASGTFSPSPERQPISYRTAVQSTTQLQQVSSAAPPPASDSNSGARSHVINDCGKSFKQRRLNLNIPLSQHDPPPCTLFYLAANGCKHGDDCRFGHDYVLDSDGYDVMQANAKKVPCPMANRGEVCSFNDTCCYGHACPFLGRCHYFKQGKCKFAGPNMHRETPAPQVIVASPTLRG